MHHLQIGRQQSHFMSCYMTSLKLFSILRFFHYRYLNVEEAYLYYDGSVSWLQKGQAHQADPGSHMWFKAWSKAVKATPGSSRDQNLRHVRKQGLKRNCSGIPHIRAVPSRIFEKPCIFKLYVLQKKCRLRNVFYVFKQRDVWEK